MTSFTRLFLTIVAIGSTVCSTMPANAESSPSNQAESTSTSLSAETPNPPASEDSTNLAKSIAASEDPKRETVAAKPSAPSNPRIPLASRIFPVPSMQQ